MRSSLRTLARHAAALLPAALIAGPALAQSAAPHAGHATSAGKIGLVIVAHGANAEWNNRVREVVARVNWPHGPVKLAFLMGSEAATASWDSATVALQRDAVAGIVAVPFMVSTFGSHVRQVEFYAGARAELPKELAAMGHDHGGHTPLTVPARVTPALDDAPELGEAMFARWSELSEKDRARPVLLVAHGPNDGEDAKMWNRHILATASRLAAAVAPRPVRLGLLRDDAPPAVRAAAVAAMRDTITALAARAKDSVTVLPVLISTGSVNTVKIPADLAGMPISYRPAGLAPHPALAKWIERVATAQLDAVRTAAKPAHAGHRQGNKQM